MKVPKQLQIYLLFWLALWLFNSVVSYLNFDELISTFMAQIQEAEIDFTEEQARSIFTWTTVFVSFIQIIFVFFLYRGVNAVRMIDLFFKILGLPFSLFGLLSIAALPSIEQLQNILSIILTIAGIVVLLLPEVKAYFKFDASTAKAEVSDASIENIEKQL